LGGKKKKKRGLRAPGRFTLGGVPEVLRTQKKETNVLSGPRGKRVLMNAWGIQRANKKIPL